MRRLKEFLGVVTDKTGFVREWESFDARDEVETFVAIGTQPGQADGVRIGYIYAQVAVAVPELSNIRFVAPKTSLLRAPDLSEAATNAVDDKK